MRPDIAQVVRLDCVAASSECRAHVARWKRPDKESLERRHP